MTDSDRHFPTAMKGPSIAFAILFAISGICHVFQSITYKTWGYTWFLPPSCIIFTVGFIFREYYARHPDNPGTFATSQSLLYSGVIIMSASLYALLSRLLAAHPSLSPLKPTHIYIFATTFIFCILISITSQGLATFFNLGASPGSVSSGLALLKASLVMHFVLTATAIALLEVFNRRCVATGLFLDRGGKKLRAAMWTLYFLAMLVLTRDVYRVVQIWLPFDSVAWTSEGLFWGFDASTMIVFALVLNAMHSRTMLGLESGLC